MDGFVTAFEEMLKNPNNRAMLGTMNFSHASFALVRPGGVYQDVYQIGVLLFKADAHIGPIVQHNMSYPTQDSGCILVGKITSQDKKPYAIVLNRGVPNLPMVVVGPNRIYYD
jgi:hypothetical protein